MSSTTYNIILPITAMKVHHHHFPRGFRDLHLAQNDSAACTRRLPQNDVVPTPQVETQAGGTRWNPTQEQIGILEMLYSGGMRTPNSHQIEQIAVQLSKFGRIEGKNVFYWFQNHKARERQKLKRLSPPNTSSFLSYDTSSKDTLGANEHATTKRKCTSWAFENFIEEGSRTLITNELANSKWDTQGKEGEDGHGDKKTLELFPLHPEGK